MSEDFVEYESESWFTRIKNAIIGVGIGILIFIIGFPVLFYGEGDYIYRMASIDQFSDAVVEVDKPLDANDGKPVIVSDTAQSNETLTDSWGYSVENAIKLKRNVEMYQWEEDKKKEKVKEVGGGETTKTTYRYEKKWSSSPIDSSRFKKSGYDNPPFPSGFQSQTLQAKQVQFGEFELTEELVNEISTYESAALPDNAVESLNLPDPPSAAQPQPTGGGLYWGQNPSSPQIGDLKAEYQMIGDTEATVAAVQKGKTFSPFVASNDYKIYRIFTGSPLTKAGVVSKLESESSMMLWIFRAVGMAMLVGGIYMVFRPLVVIADVLPFLGDILSYGAWLFAAVIGIPLGLITIGIAKLYYQPLIGILLIGAAIAIVVGVRAMLPKKSAPEPA